MTPHSTTTYLVLDVDGSPCALPQTAVREVLPLPYLHSPPAAGGPLAGFMNLGGAPIPVLDLARLLGKRDGASDTNPYRHVLLDTDGALALLVDRVTDVVRVPVDQIGPVDGERTLNGCVEAEITLGGRLVHVLSMERLLTLEERERIAAFRQRAADRLAALDTAAID